MIAQRHQHEKGAVIEIFVSPIGEDQVLDIARWSDAVS